MIKKINKSEEIKKGWEAQGKTTFLDKPEHIKAIDEVNKAMQDVRREYKLKDQNSFTSAEETILTS